jgi:eukaryotic-like serine/threonine-protein kinase
MRFRPGSGKRSSDLDSAVSAALVLTIVSGAGAGEALRITQPRRLVVGRGDDADWRINDPFVSRHHVLLEVCPPACRLQDLGIGGGGSLNAPRHNGRPVRRCDLKDGDIFVVGLTSVRVSIEVGRGEAASPTPVAQRDQKKPNDRAAVEVRDVLCQSCGIDLTGVANSDGRAAELFGRVGYVCEACLPPGDLFQGTVVGRYELRRLLGEGGMGTVCLAYDRGTARLVALKRIVDLGDRTAVRRFAREVRILGLLEHLRVVGFVEADIDKAGAPFVVTEYIPGGNLERLMQRKGKLPPARAIALICQALEGLEYLHNRRVIHRDFKPENILLRSSDSEVPPSVVLTDFGISRYYEEAGGTSLTKPNTRMGTLMFMPPEQVSDASAAREPADVYAAGVTLYYLLSGSYTFEFPSPAQIREFRERARAFRSPDQMVREIMRMERVRHPFRIILEEEPIPLFARAPHVPRPLAAIVDKAVRKDVEQRFKTVKEFRRELSDASVGS